MILPVTKQKLFLVILTLTVVVLLFINFLFWNKILIFYENLQNRGKQVVLINRSSRMEAEFKDKQSAGKVKEAILLTFAKKEGLSVTEPGGKIEIPVSFLELDENCRQKEQKTEVMVDLKKPVRLVVWDKPCGFGSGNATRIQFSVNNKQLSIMIYWVDNPPKTAVISGLIEGLEILFNNGAVNYTSEILIPEVKTMLVHKLPDGGYEPEIITTGK